MAQAQLNILPPMQTQQGSDSGLPSDNSCQLHVMDVVTSAAISHLEACRRIARRLQGKRDQSLSALVTSSSEDIQSEQVEDRVQDPINLSTPPYPSSNLLDDVPTALRGGAYAECGMQEGRMEGGGMGGGRMELQVTGAEVAGREVGEYVEWAKYGRRQLAGASFWRHYYKCRHFRTGCPAKRFEDVSLADNRTVVGGGVEGGEHTHPPSLKFKPRKRKRKTAAAGDAAGDDWGGEQQGGDVGSAVDVVGFGGWDIEEGLEEGVRLDVLEGEGIGEWVEKDDTSLQDLFNFQVADLDGVCVDDIWH